MLECFAGDVVSEDLNISFVNLKQRSELETKGPCARPGVNIDNPGYISKVE